MCKVLLSYVLVEHSYGLEYVIIACGHLTNMQGCHGNCSRGCMCVQSTMVEGTCIMQIYNLKMINCLRQFLLVVNIMLPWQPY